MSDHPDEPPPWSAEHRRWVKARIDDAAARMREVLGAHDVLVVAWFQDIAQPAFLHVQDGGTAPLPPGEVYRYMMQTVRVRQAVEAGETVLEVSGDGEGKARLVDEAYPETNLERKLAKRYRGYKEESGSDDSEPGSSTVQ